MIVLVLRRGYEGELVGRAPIKTAKKLQMGSGGSAKMQLDTEGKV
jgi:hypothetical protein